MTYNDDDDLIMSKGPAYFVVDLSGYRDEGPPTTASDRAAAAEEERREALWQAMMDGTDLPEGAPSELRDIRSDPYFASDVADQVRRTLVREAADQRLREIRGELVPELPVAQGLADLLAQPDDEMKYTVADLWPVGGNVLFAAPAKWGKSSCTMNLIKALADGVPFLDHFVTNDPMAEGEKILYVDLEMSESRVRSEFRLQQVENQDSIIVVVLRGQASRFDISNEQLRQLWVDFCLENNVRTLVLDPLAPLLGYFGTEENDNSAVNKFFQMVDAFKSDAGIRDLMVVHHCGHMADWRPRGASRFNDWPDALWLAKLDGDVSDPESPRLFFARGRDVGEGFSGAGAVVRDEQKKLSFTADVTPSQKGEINIGMVENVVFQFPGLTQDELVKKLRACKIKGSGVKLTEVIQEMGEQGQLHGHQLKRRGSPTLWYPDEARCTYCQVETQEATDE